MVVRATLRWVLPRIPSAAYILLVSAGSFGLMWVTTIASPISHGPREWGAALGIAVGGTAYLFSLVTAFTSILFGPIALLRAALPNGCKWISLVAATFPAAIWSLAFYGYVVWSIAAAVDICLPPGRELASGGCQLMP